MQAVRVLVGVDTFERGVLVEVPRQRQLDDVARAGRVGVQFVDRGVELFLRDVGGQITPDLFDADAGTVVVLALDVGVRAGVVAHQDGAQTGHDALGPQLLHPHAQISEDLVAGGFSVKSYRTHRAHYSTMRFGHSAT